MASGLINSWQIEGERVEAVKDFIFLSSKITADVDCSHEIRRCLLLGKKKRCLLLGEKTVTNLDIILKSRDIADKGPYSQSYGFSSSHLQI